MSVLDPARFEGVYNEEPPEYQVVRRDANREATDDVVLSAPTIDVRDRVLVIEYRRIAPEIDERGAEQLILTALLREFLVDSYREDADTIELHDLATGTKRTIPYPAQLLATQSRSERTVACRRYVEAGLNVGDDVRFVVNWNRNESGRSSAGGGSKGEAATTLRIASLSYSALPLDWTTTAVATPSSPISISTIAFHSPEAGRRHSARIRAVT